MQKNESFIQRSLIFAYLIFLVYIVLYWIHDLLICKSFSNVLFSVLCRIAVIYRQDLTI